MIKFNLCNTDQHPQDQNTSIEPERNDKPKKKLDMKATNTWTQSDVSQWIKEIGYPEYANTFLQNNIDGQTLLDFSKDDYNSLGITSVGHRKALERHIQQLRDNIANHSHANSSSSQLNPSSDISNVHPMISTNTNSTTNISTNHDLVTSIPPPPLAYPPSQQLSSNSAYQRKEKRPNSNEWRPSTDRESSLRDRAMYLPLWTSEGSSLKNKERMSMQEYRSLMSRAQTISQETKAEIWTRIVGIDSEWCGFEQFVAMMKLTRLSQLDIPVFLIHLSKLQHYHPSTLPLFHTVSSSLVQDMPTINVSHHNNHNHNHNSSTTSNNHNTTAPTNPINSGSSNNTSNNNNNNSNSNSSQSRPIQQNMVAFRGLPSHVLDSDEMLMQLEKLALRHCSPIHFEVNGDVLIATCRATIDQNKLEQLRSRTVHALKTNLQIAPHIANKVQVTIPTTQELIGSNSDMDTSQNHGSSNANISHYSNNNGRMVTSQTGVTSSPYLNPPNLNSTSTSSNNGTDSNGMLNGGGLRSRSHSPSPMNDNVPTYLNKTEIAKLLKEANFWEAICTRVDIMSLGLDPKEKLRAKSAISVIAKIRGVPVKMVNFSDRAVSLITGKTLNDLKDKMAKPSKAMLADLLNLHIEDIPDLYKGIVIEGLPSSITGDDQVILQLDSYTLSNFSVDSIEVIGKDSHRLQIAFEHPLTAEDIDQLRKSLKAFLKDELKVDRLVMSVVMISPHTEESWKELTGNHNKSIENDNEAQSD